MADVRRRRGPATHRPDATSSRSADARRCGWCCSPAAAARARSRRRSSGCRASIVTLAINGYDDGASTGEVRRFLGDALGPSDFRKNASRLATALASLRAGARAAARSTAARRRDAQRRWRGLAAAPGAARPADRELACHRAPPRRARRSPSGCRHFSRSMPAAGRPFDFGDCAVGNLVFAGAYLRARPPLQRRRRRLRRARRPARPASSRTSPTAPNAFLVAIDVDGRVLGSEADIVDATRRNAIDDIFLVRSAARRRRVRGAHGSADRATRPHGSTRARVPTAAQPAPGRTDRARRT